jgi:hypothetical protein
MAEQNESIPHLHHVACAQSQIVRPPFNNNHDHNPTNNHNHHHHLTVKGVGFFISTFSSQNEEGVCQFRPSIDVFQYLVDICSCSSCDPYRIDAIANPQNR